MANYDAQIQDLVGTGFTDQTAMDQWMADGAKEIINVMPPKFLILWTHPHKTTFFPTSFILRSPQVCVLIDISIYYNYRCENTKLQTLYL